MHITIAEMLMNGKTTVELIRSWNKKHKANVAYAEKTLGVFSMYALIPLFIASVFTTWFSLGIQQNILSGFAFMITMISYFVLIIYTMISVCCISEIGRFKRDAHNLFLEIGAEIKNGYSLEELEKGTNNRLVRACQFVLWQQIHNPSKHKEISLRQKRVCRLYDAFEKFELASNSLEFYYNKAQIESEVPDWFTEMDPSKKPEPEPVS